MLRHSSTGFSYKLQKSINFCQERSAKRSWKMFSNLRRVEQAGWELIFSSSAMIKTCLYKYSIVTYFLFHFILHILVIIIILLSRINCWNVISKDEERKSENGRIS